MPRGTTRRRFLTSAGVAGATALAGCGGGGGGGGGGGSGDFIWYYGESDRALSQNLRRVVNANARGIQVQLQKGGSDVENLKRVHDGKADFTVVGGGLAYFARNGSGIPEFRVPQSNLRGVGSLYPRPVTIFKSPTVDAETLRDLSGVRVNIGPSGTGLSLNASLILNGSEIQFTPGRDDMITGIRKAARGDIAAAAALGDWPIQAAQEIARNSELGALSLTERTRSRALQSSQWMVDTRLPAAVYEGIEYPINSVGPMTIIVTRQGISAGKILRVTEAIFEHTDQITVRSGYISKKTGTRRMPIGLHQGANNYFNF